MEQGQESKLVNKLVEQMMVLWELGLDWKILMTSTQVWKMIAKQSLNLKRVKWLTLKKMMCLINERKRELFATDPMEKTKELVKGSG